MAFSPDRKRLIAVTQAGSMHVIDLATRAEVASVRPPQEMRAECAAMAPDGSFVVAGGSGKQAFLWRPATGERKVLAGAHQSNIWDLAIASDGRTIYTGDQEGRVARWSADGELVAPCPWLSTKGPARVMRLRSDTLVVAGNELVIAPTAGGEPRRTRLPNPPNHLLELSPDADRIFLAKLGVEGLFDTAGRTARLPGTSNRWFSGSLSARGDRVAIGNRGSVRLYDLSATANGTDGIDTAPYRDCPVGEGPAGMVRFSDDGKRMFARAEDNVVHVFDGEGELLLRLPSFFKQVKGIPYDADSQILATGDDWGIVRLWDTRTCRRMPPEFQVPGGRSNGFATDSTDPLIVRRDNGRLVAFPVDGSEPWIAEAGDRILDDARVRRDGRLLATAARDGTAGVCDLTTRQRLWVTPGNEANPAVGVDFLPGERLLVVTSTRGVRACEVQAWRIGQEERVPCADNSARIYNLRGGLLAHCVGHGKRVERAHSSPSGRWVVTSSQDGSARIFHAATGVSEAEVVVGAPSPVWDALFSPDEKLLYTVSVDGVVRAGCSTATSCGRWRPLRPAGSRARFCAKGFTAALDRSFLRP